MYYIKMISWTKGALDLLLHWTMDPGIHRDDNWWGGSPYSPRSLAKKDLENILTKLGARGGNRTLMSVTSHDFESCAYTSSATLADYYLDIIPEELKLISTK